jgi:hypothetical protein
MKFFRCSAAALLVALCLSASLQAKGPTTRIVITAPNLPVPLEITDAASLDEFSVWAGPGTSLNGVEASDGFIIDWRAGARADRLTALPRYEVQTSCSTRPTSVRGPATSTCQARATSTSR